MKNNVAFFSTVTDDYALYAATSLLSVRRKADNVDLFIISTKLSAKTKKTLDFLNIKYIEIDLSKQFTKSWDYPVECFYIFAGPEIFLKMGYAYSVYMDGDVLCTKDPLKGIHFNDIKVAGVESSSQNGSYSSIFGGDWAKLRKLFDLPKSYEQRPRINSGAVYFNNESMDRINLLNGASELYKICLENEVPRKGDDSLFSLFQYVNMKEEDIKILPSKYNFVLQFNEWKYPVEDLRLFHFSLDKPWKAKPYKHSDPKLKIFNPYVRKYRMLLMYVSLVHSTLNKFGRLRKNQP